MTDGDKILLGDGGFDIIATTGTKTPATGYRWTALLALNSDVELSSFDADNCATAAMTIPAGITIPARWNKLVITSGTALMYKAKL
jgi:hypothetical protein